MTKRHAADYFDAAILQKYEYPGPCYRSYPPIREFSPGFTELEFERAIKTRVVGELSLYLHIPFCQPSGYYIEHNKPALRCTEKADKYLDALIQEMAFRVTQVGKQAVTRVHFGGATLSFLTAAQLERLMLWIFRLFNIKPNAQISINIDPHHTPLNYIDQLGGLGFTRLAIKLPDAPAIISRGINPEQSTLFVKQLIERARRSGMPSVDIELTCGSPHQTLTSFICTLEDVQSLNPDRVSLFSYTYLPQRFAAQSETSDERLILAQSAMVLMRMASGYLLDGGYEMIGVDLFVKPNDKLAVARREGRLYRNFEGYTVSKGADILGVGASAMSNIGNIYCQNSEELQQYCEAVERMGHALEKGIVLTDDDLVRRFVIEELMCNLKVNKREVELIYDIDFDLYFADAMQRLAPYCDDKIVENCEHSLTVKKKAQLAIGSICKAFDSYLSGKKRRERSGIA